MSTRRPKVPRTGAPAGTPGSEAREDDRDDRHDDGASPVMRPARAPSVASQQARPTTSAMPVSPRPAARPTQRSQERVGPSDAGARAADEEKGRRRLLPGLPGRRRSRAGASPASSSRFTVSREDGRVSYAYTDGGARTPSAGSTAVRPVPAKAFSGRLLALALVLVTITILLAPTVRTYLGQRAEISSLQQSIQGEQDRKDYLQEQLSRWNDPAYVKQQARDRLFYVMPGETGYLVIGADSTDNVPPVATSAESESGPEPWMDSLWTSVRSAADDRTTTEK